MGDSGSHLRGAGRLTEHEVKLRHQDVADFFATTLHSKAEVRVTAG